MNGVLLRQSDLRHGPVSERVRVWQVDGPPEKGTAFQREWWDGRLDARVCPKPVSMVLAEAPWVEGRNGVIYLNRLFVPRPVYARMSRQLRRMLKDDLGAITGSGIYAPTWIDKMDTTQLALDLDLETHKGSLFNNTVTTNYETDTAYGVAPYDANEVSGGAGWPAGGVALTSTVYTNAMSGKMVFDGADVSQTPTTLAAAELYMLYADALVGNNAIAGIDFTAPVSTTNGLFEITWTAPGSGGIFNQSVIAA